MFKKTLIELCAEKNIEVFSKMVGSWFPNRLQEKLQQPKIKKRNPLPGMRSVCLPKTNKDLFIEKKEEEDIEERRSKRFRSH